MEERPQVENNDVTFSKSFWISFPLSLNHLENRLRGWMSVSCVSKGAFISASKRMLPSKSHIGMCSCFYASTYYPATPLPSFTTSGEGKSMCVAYMQAHECIWIHMCVCSRARPVRVDLQQLPVRISTKTRGHMHSYAYAYYASVHTYRWAVRIASCRHIHYAYADVYVAHKSVSNRYGLWLQLAVIKREPAFTEPLAAPKPMVSTALLMPVASLGTANCRGFTTHAKALLQLCVDMHTCTAGPYAPRPCIVSSCLHALNAHQNAYSIADSIE